jgi:NhaP-type Na+/H+ or K+/H+ antiporter
VKFTSVLGLVEGFLVGIIALLVSTYIADKDTAIIVTALSVVAVSVFVEYFWTRHLTREMLRAIEQELDAQGMELMCTGKERSKAEDELTGPVG